MLYYKNRSIKIKYTGYLRPPIQGSEARVQIGEKIKYLGLQLDATWSFGEHFRCLAPRVEGVAMALGRLFPNLGRPGGRVRRVYTAVVASVALYGAPVWAEDVAVTRRLRDLLRRLQRRMAIRAARGYRTISHAAATALTGMAPLDLAARMYSNMYKRVRGIRENGAEVTGGVRRMIRDQARRSMILEWQRSLEDPHIAGRRTVEAIRPVLPEWVERVKREGITYRMTQALTGHGCFPVQDRQGAHREVPPLRPPARLGAAHAGILPSVGGRACNSGGRGGGGPLPPGRNTCYGREDRGMAGDVLLLRQSDAAEGGRGKGEARRRSSPGRPS